MTDTWGPITIPLGDQPDDQAQGDPALSIIGDFIKTYLVTDQNAVALWTKSGVAPTKQPIEAVVVGRIDDKGYQLAVQKLPTLFLWREGGASERWGDDWEVFRDQVKLLWVFPAANPKQHRSRLPFVNALYKCIYNGLELGQTPGWRWPGDTDPDAPTEGSLVYTFAGFVHFNFRTWRQVTVKVRGETERGIVGEFPAIEITYEIVENRQIGLDVYPILKGATDTISVTTVAPYTTWMASTFYPAGSFVVPIAANNFYYLATTGGFSGGSAPSFPTTVGATVTDGAVVWTCIGLVSEVEVSGPLETPSTSTGGGITPGAQAVITRVSEANSPYTAKLTDDLILFDNSATGGQLVVNLENAPIQGQKHRFKWWKGQGITGGVGPVINVGAGATIDWWVDGTSGHASAAITTLTGEGEWEFVGTTTDGTTVNAWVLVS